MKIRMVIDEGWYFCPNYPGLPFHQSDPDRPATMEIPDELIERYNTAFQEFRNIHSIMEELYRLQEGMSVTQSILEGIDVKILNEQRRKHDT